MRQLARALLILMALVAAANSTSAQLPGPRTQWTVAESDNFSVLSDASEKRAQAVALSLEALHSVLEGIAVKQRRGPKTLVYAFERSRTFEHYSPFDDASSVAGFFTNSLLRNFISIDLSKDDRGSTVYHELLHEFAATNFPGVPLWFNEGLAEYYSTFELAGGYAEVGRIVDLHIRWLRVNDLLPVQTLFEVTRDSPSYNEGSKRGIFYAQSWAAVHYLLSDPERTEQLKRFLAELDQGVEGDQAFRLAFRVEFEQFDRELVRYVDGRSFQFSKIPIEASEISVSVRRASKVETLARLGELLAAGRENALARQHLLAAVQGEENLRDARFRADARAILAWLAWEEGDRQRARQLFNQASQDAGSVASRLYQGMLELEDVVATVAVGGGTIEHQGVQTAQRALSEALALEPDWPKAQAALGMTYLYGGDAEEGIEILLRATELRPSDPNPWMSIALLRAKQGQFSVAWNLLVELESLLQRTPSREFSPDRLRLARDTVALFHSNQASTSYNEGDFDRALALAASLEGRLRPNELSRHQSHLQEIRSEIARSRGIDRLNDLIRLANAGRYQETLAELDALIAEGVLTDDALRHARELRKQLVAFLDG